MAEGRPEASPETSVDAFLGGRVEAVQPLRLHHRSGLDAVLLAAAVPAAATGRFADLGAGAGVAGMALAARVNAVDVLLVEREADLVACAAAALQRPANAAFAARVAARQSDLLSATSRRDAGLGAGSLDGAIANPPFFAAGAVRASPDAARSRAHVLEAGGIDAWLRAAAALVGGGGEVSVIFPAQGLPALLAACANRLGDLAVLPVHPRPGTAALRILVRGRRGSRGPVRLLPGLVLHKGDGNAFSPELVALLRDGAGLEEIVPEWTGKPGRPPRRS